MTISAYLSPIGKFRGVSNTNGPLVGGLVYTYAAGTTTPIATYTDSTAGTPNANPVVLNSRGEADIWMLPNVGYKFVLADQYGSLIWTQDNVFLPQLLTVYGGVDTGAANAYILNFTANFTALTDGIYIVWIPAYTNTSASTINVNGLGVITIQNPNGSSLAAGQIIANQPATILYKGGAWELISSIYTIYGTWTPTFSGFSVAPAGTFYYRKTGNIITLSFPNVTGTSNGTSFVITSGIPFPPSSSMTSGVFGAAFMPVVGLVDSGSAIAGGACAITAGGILNFYKDGTAVNNWTNTGSKGWSLNTQVTYSV